MRVCDVAEAEIDFDSISAQTEKRLIGTLGVTAWSEIME